MINNFFTIITLFKLQLRMKKVLALISRKIFMNVHEAIEQKLSRIVENDLHQ